jgi:hypothetical protein
MLLKNSVRTSKRTPYFTITKINWLTLFKEMIAVYSENHAESIATNAQLLIVTAGGKYRSYWALKGQYTPGTLLYLCRPYSGNCTKK